ncbi:SPIRE2 [Cordylochernes scorpioides]|uniref:SPIRE2 n=1 Tax=Cordylochernes scorpioides TaxID=51811 RepID=A0ABY6LDX8_9ARAC|nr:SPIRE2 [Cordylochernes scorpioides]
MVQTMIIMVNGDIPPRVKKDARALILEFIRSRPPLTPAAHRKLKPLPPRQLTLYEKLMLSLKQKHKLRPTRTRERVLAAPPPKKAPPQEEQPPQRRLIKPDPELSLLDDLEDIPSGIVSVPESPLHSYYTDAGYPVEDQRTRRHSISLCERIPSPEPPDPSPGRPTSFYQHYSSKTKISPPAQLVLNLDEVVHIRHVLTKAELESMLFTKGAPFPLYYDLVKGKVCFCCKQTRFSFFGSKGTPCKLCERIVCDKCTTRMRLPLECPASIPVCLLTPSPEEDQERPLLLPKKVSHNDCIINNNNLRHSQSFSHMPASTAVSTETCSLPELTEDTPLMPVCRECKYMVCYIVTPPELRPEPPSLSSDIIPL